MSDLTMDLCKQCGDIYGQQVVWTHMVKDHGWAENSGSPEHVQTPADANNVNPLPSGSEVVLPPR
jgi:hypothetical protein